MKRVILLLLLINGVYLISPAQSFICKDSIFEQAKRSDKCIFMVFSGSDWCANCIRFDKQILRDTTFHNFINNALLFLNVDFPQRKKQSSLLKKQNELLAEQYNPNGIFPTLILLSPDKKNIPIFYQQETVPQFIDKIKKALITLKEQDGAQN